MPRRRRRRLRSHSCCDGSNGCLPADATIRPMDRTPSPAAISTRALTKHYGSIRALTDLSLDVRQGEIFGFLGPNGAGKSTTIRTLLGYLHATSGEASVLGMDVAT